jgi:antitoxin (DNA-binding transcriptional repressor) of toxin-antitoxin stability system
MAESEITISASAFKAKCLDLFKRLERGTLKRITVTRRGKPVAMVVQRPPAKKPTADDIHAAMGGTITVAPGVDLTEPLGIPEPDDPFIGR